MWLLILLLFPSMAFAQVVRVDSKTFEEPTRFDVLTMKQEVEAMKKENMQDQKVVDQLKAMITDRSASIQRKLDKVEEARVAGVEEAGQ